MSTPTIPLLRASTRSRRARAVAVLVFAVLLSVGSTPGGSAQEDADRAEAVTWGIGPSSPAGPDGRTAFEYELDPGDDLEDYVGVSNFTDEPLELAVYASDAITTPDGAFDLLPASEEPIDVGSWIAFADESVTVPPRSRLDLPFRLDIPDNATPGDHVGGIVASRTTTTTGDDGSQVAVDRRVGARIYLRVSGDVTPTATITDVTVRHDSAGLGGAAEVTYTVTNTGNLRLRGTPTIEVEGLFGIGRRAVDGTEIPELLPDKALTHTVVVPDVRPAVRLRATVQLEATGIDDDTPVPPATGHATTWAVPWLVLAFLAVGTIVAVIVRRRRSARRRRTEAQISAAREQGRAEALDSSRT